MSDTLVSSEASRVPTLTRPPPIPVHILVVDDNAAKRLALKSVLLPLGYSIVEADSGKAALRCVLAQDFAVILLDVRMPIMDGFETAALIRLRWQSEMTPIIFVTSNASSDLSNAKRFTEGAVDFLFSPVRPDELRAKVSVFANLFVKAETLARQAREIQISADQLRLLTDAAPIGIFQTDSQNRYSYTNPRWSELTGVRAEQALGEGWFTILAPEDREAMLATLSGRPIEESEFCERFHIYPPGVEPRVVLMTSKMIPAVDGGVAGWVGTLADITAETRAETVMSAARDKATEATQLKSDFLANMSHEIRTPMNGVIGMTDLLLETDLDARQRDFAQTVRNSGEALLTIINDILDFSRIEAGKLEVEVVEFDLRVVLHHVVDLLAGPAQAHGLELIAVVDRAVPTLVEGDPGRVRQVLTNLIGNAIKFTSNGEIVVRVSMVEAKGDRTVVRFEVSDTGDGISMDKLDTIFRPFVQADTSTSRKYGGTGLGLAICSQLVGLMGGSSGVTSELGVGSVFWFTIDVKSDACQWEPDIGLTAAGLMGVEGLAGIEVLVVDDNATQRSVLSGWLTEWGMRVTTNDTGGAALATLRDAADRGHPFSVALIDQGMPGMDGLTLSTSIDDDAALFCHPVLMTQLKQVYGLDNSSHPEGWLTLSKPIHLTQLRTSLLAALGVGPDAGSDAGSESGPEASGYSQGIPPPIPMAAKPETGRLLLAEDNIINQKVANAMLSSAGYHVDTVKNGALAIEALAAHHYDAILMDCQMPELNGYEATAIIRAQEGSGQRIPIIALTAGARPEDRERCMAEGMDAYLAKPLNKEVLLSVVAQAMRHDRSAAVFGQ